MLFARGAEINGKGEFCEKTDDYYYNSWGIVIDYL